MNQNNPSGFLNNPLNEHDYYSTRDNSGESMSTNESSQQTEVVVDGLQVRI
jgi:hypothetical protein